jgi:LacI family transcriptional regulator
VVGKAEQEPAAGDRRTGKPTINDVARLSGVSKKTVSQVINRSPLLNGGTRERVLGVIRDLGYVPNPQARALALRTNFLIGLIHDSPNAQTVLSAQQGVLEALQGSDYAMVVRPVDRGSPTLIDDVRWFLEHQRPHGVVILPPLSGNEAVGRLCGELGCSYVRMGSAELGDPDHMIASDDREAVAGAVRHLIAQGHRRIGLVTGPHGLPLATHRRLGFEDALAEAGITVPDGFVTEGNYTFESGVAAGDRLLGLSPRPTAIFASNDEMAVGVLHAARMRDLDVPEDLSVIGFDDSPIAGLIWPPLTTVRWPIVDMARAAALKLLAGDGGADEKIAESSLFVSKLIERASVAGPKD